MHETYPSEQNLSGIITYLYAAGRLYADLQANEELRHNIFFSSVVMNFRILPIYHIPPQSIEHYLHDAFIRVPTQILFSNSLCFPCVFPVKPQIFPVSIYIICDDYLYNTDWQIYPASGKKMEIFAANITISFTFRESWNLQLEQTKFPVFWQNFQIPCVFPDRDFFPSIFPVFPVPWVP